MNIYAYNMFYDSKTKRRFIMSIINKHVFSAFCLISSIALAGCSSVPCKPMPKPKSNHIAERAVIGGAAGATIGALVAKEPVTGAVVGGAVGAGFGALTGLSKISPPPLQRFGVQYVNLHGRLVVLIPTHLIFENNSADFNQNAPIILTPLAKYLHNYPNADIHISGNASPILDHKLFSKIRISTKRATKVAGYLWQEGINKGCRRKLTFSGNGADYPISTNKVIQGLTENRRIQIVAYPHGLTPYPNGTPPDTKLYKW